MIILCTNTNNENVELINIYSLDINMTQYILKELSINKKIIGRVSLNKDTIVTNKCYHTINEYILPWYFFCGPTYVVPSLTMFKLINEGWVEKIIKLYNKVIVAQFSHTNLLIESAQRYIDCTRTLEKNYKKYISECIVREIIE